MFATGETIGLAEWIIDDACLVSYKFFIAITSYFYIKEFKRYVFTTFKYH